MMAEDEDLLSSTIGILAERWSNAASLLPAFPLLARGTPLATADIAQSTGIPVERMEDVVRFARCERDPAGRLIELYGMTLSPTLHRVEIESRIVYSCCALWAHVIPKLVGRVARIESVDPVRRQLIRLKISPDGIEATEPASAMATLVHTTREAAATDVGAAFCTHVLHFVSRESAEQYIAGASNRQVVGLPELKKAADMLHRAILEASKSKTRS